MLFQKVNGNLLVLIKAAMLLIEVGELPHTLYSNKDMKCKLVASLLPAEELTARKMVQFG